MLMNHQSIFLRSLSQLIQNCCSLSTQQSANAPKSALSTLHSCSKNPQIPSSNSSEMVSNSGPVQLLVLNISSLCYLADWQFSANVMLVISKLSVTTVFTTIVLSEPDLVIQTVTSFISPSYGCYYCCSLGSLPYSAWSNLDGDLIFDSNLILYLPMFLVNSTRVFTLAIDHPWFLNYCYWPETSVRLPSSVLIQVQMKEAYLVDAFYILRQKLYLGLNIMETAQDLRDFKDMSLLDIALRIIQINIQNEGSKYNKYYAGTTFEQYFFHLFLRFIQHLTKPVLMKTKDTASKICLLQIFQYLHKMNRCPWIQFSMRLKYRKIIQKITIDNSNLIVLKIYYTSSETSNRSTLFFYNHYLLIRELLNKWLIFYTLHRRLRLIFLFVKVQPSSSSLYVPLLLLQFLLHFSIVQRKTSRLDINNVESLHMLALHYLQSIFGVKIGQLTVSVLLSILIAFLAQKFILESTRWKFVFV